MKLKQLPLGLYAPMARFLRRLGFVPEGKLHTAESSIQAQRERIERLHARHARTEDARSQEHSARIRRLKEAHMKENAHLIRKVRQLELDAQRRLEPLAAASTQVRTEAEIERERNQRIHLYRQALIKLVPRTASCDKVLHWTKDDAWLAARQSERIWGQEPHSLNTYECTKCPPRPVDGGLFFHNGRPWKNFNGVAPEGR